MTASLIKYLNQENYHSYSLAIFRVLIGCLILGEVLFMIPHVNDFFTLNSWNTPSYQYHFLAILRNNIYLFFIVYGLILFLFILGIGHNFTAMLVVICYYLKYFLAPELSDGGKLFLGSILLPFSFCNSFEYFCVLKPKPSQLSNLISNCAYVIVILYHLLFYFDVGVFKLFTIGWYNGEGVWYALNSFEINALSNTRFIYNGLLLKLLNYGAIAFQILFPFLVLYKPTKLFILAVGLFFHLSIAIVFNLYYFQLIMLVLYLLYFTNDQWHLWKVIKK